MLAVGFGSIQFWRVRSCASSSVFLWGAIAWMAGVAAKSVAAIASPFVEAEARHLLPVFSAPVLWLYTGLLTGVFECGATLLFAGAIKKLRNANWSEAVGFGIGFGAAEAVAVAGVSLVLIGLRLTVPQMRTALPLEYQDLAAPVSAAEYLTPALERLGAIIVHTFAAVLIIHTIRTAAWRWFWLAFAYKTAIDAVPAEMLTGQSAWLLLLPYLPFIITGLVGTWMLRSHWMMTGSETTVG